MSTYYAGEKRQDQPRGRVAEGVIVENHQKTELFVHSIQKMSIFAFCKKQN